MTEMNRVIGLYGLPAAGKTYLLNKIQSILNSDHFLFFDGSKVIAMVVPGGIEQFKVMDDGQKVACREVAIRKIYDFACNRGKAAVVAGHYSFWDKATQSVKPVWTSEDNTVYTHIIYLETSPDVIAARCAADMTRTRKSHSIQELTEWQRMELVELRKVCRENRIHFIGIRPGKSTEQDVVNLLRDFHIHNDAHNSRVVMGALDNLVGNNLESGLAVVLDADKTLAPFDVSKLLCDAFEDLAPAGNLHATLDDLFHRHRYTYRAFRQATLLFEELASWPGYTPIAENISVSVQLYPEMEDFLREICEYSHVEIVVVTCGLGEIWQKTVDNLNLPRKVHVIGGGRIKFGYVVTPKIKGQIVAHLKTVHNKTVYAIGDSAVDFEMLERADEALVAVPPEEIRSKSVEGMLAEAISDRDLKACQVLLGTTCPRLDTQRLPITTMSEVSAKIREETGKMKTLYSRITHFTDKPAAKVLMTMTRNSNTSGRALRKAHKAVGRFLALNGLTEVMGLDEHEIPHVQGATTQGYRIRGDSSTTIVALMRGGEPLAYGVDSIFGKAMFVHATSTADVQAHHIDAQSCVLLVDSVINSGVSAVEFIHYIRGMLSDVRIIVVADVVQASAILLSNELGRILYEDGRVNLVALRLSRNKYTGFKGTDTGNRLFNTEHLP